MGNGRDNGKRREEKCRGFEKAHDEDTISCVELGQRYELK